MRGLLALPVIALLLAGCGAHGPFRDRGYDYLLAEATPPLAYPAGIAPIATRELYPIADVENRRRVVTGEKREIEIPTPPALVVPEDSAKPSASAGDGRLPPAKVLLTRDGNEYPVLMLDLAFDWAWQQTGDALSRQDGVKVDDVDRERAVYFLVVDGKRNSADDPWQLKLNRTANGIQVALQVDEDAMAPKEIAGPLLEKLREGLLR